MSAGSKMRRFLTRTANACDLGRYVGPGGVRVECARAGIYSSFDAEEEIRRYHRQYDIFGPKVLDVLSTIPDPNPVTNPPIRRRYLFIESLAETGALKLDTVEHKLDYSTVLIRRNEPKRRPSDEGCERA